MCKRTVLALLSLVLVTGSLGCEKPKTEAPASRSATRYGSNWSGIDGFSELLVVTEGDPNWNVPGNQRPSSIKSRSLTYVRDQKHNLCFFSAHVQYIGDITSGRTWDDSMTEVPCARVISQDDSPIANTGGKPWQNVKHFIKLTDIASDSNEIELVEDLRFDICYYVENGAHFAHIPCEKALPMPTPSTSSSHLLKPEDI